MLPRRFGALDILERLSKSPGLIRSKTVISKPERPWPIGASPEIPPIDEIWKHPGRNYSVPITIYNVPNNSPAYTSWPTLKNFMPALNPRAYKTVKPGGEYKIQVEDQLALMPYMYHDLGVLVFEGPTKEQSQIIGDILQKIVKDEGRLQSREWDRPYSTKVCYDKWNVYRLSVDERLHIDWLLKPEKRGFLHPRGLDELTDMAVQKWREDWQAKREAEGRNGRMPVRFIKDTKKMWLLRNKGSMGLINETINGPRITSVDAYVATTIRRKVIWMNVELHTVGTKRFLGCASFQFEANVDHDLREKRLEHAQQMGVDPETIGQLTQTNKKQREEVNHKLDKIYSDEAPSSLERQEPIVPDTTRKLWKLEKSIWKK